MSKSVMHHVAHVFFPVLGFVCLGMMINASYQNDRLMEEMRQIIFTSNRQEMALGLEVQGRYERLREWATENHVNGGPPPLTVTPLRLQDLAQQRPDSKYYAGVLYRFVTVGDWRMPINTYGDHRHHLHILDSDRHGKVGWTFVGCPKDDDEEEWIRYIGQHVQ